MMADTAAETEADSGTANESLNDNETTTTTTTTTNNEENETNESNDQVTPSTNYEQSTKVTLQQPQQQTTPHTTNNNESVKMEIENNNPAPDRIHRKMFECDVCQMKFSNGANMRRHKMRHTGVKPYECRVCQKRFFRKDHLAEHFTTHTKTLPFHCPICNRGFQRQIAMRAHFQNEHVGQHDLVKSCPLCSYRTSTMKSLRVHFFNRHGIDLDNPGPIDSTASLFVAAAQQQQQQQQRYDNALLGNLGGNVSVSVTANYSDSGDSTGARSTDNATPPMHFLTPHVEISMADAPAPVFSPTLNEQSQSAQRMNGDCPVSPQSADSNSNAPSSSHHHHHLRLDQETNITPSISLIPIKQEPNEDMYDVGSNNKRNGSNPSTSPSGSVVQTATSSSLSSLIKVSPLKSLLRDDLKRKIVSRMSTTSPRGGRSTSSPNQNPESSPNDGTTNGAITSTDADQPSDSWRTLGGSKRGLLSGLQCIFCGIGFPDQTLYFLHKGCHSDANPWKCNICGEQCCNVYEFNSHLLSKSHQ